MSVMNSSKCVIHCVLCLIYFHLAATVNHKQFKTAEERNAYLYNHSYGCTNLKELRAGELHEHREHIPRCGCGFYGVRMFDNDPRQDLYNVTITTSKGRIQRFECKQCDLCLGLKVKSVCKPKKNTECLPVCEDPCETYIKVLGICGPDKDKCPETPTTTDTVVLPVTSTQQPTPETTTHPVPVGELEPRKEPEGDNYYLSWLIVAAVVITASVIAVILIIIVVLCNQNRMHKHSDGGSNNTSSNSLLPSTPQLPTGAGEPV